MNVKKGIVCTMAALYSSLLPLNIEAKSLTHAGEVHAKPHIMYDNSYEDERDTIRTGMLATLGDVIMAQEYSREVYRIGGLGIDYTLGTSDHEVAASAEFDFGPTRMYLDGRLSSPHANGSYGTFYEVGLGMDLDPCSLLVRYTYEPHDEEWKGFGTLDVSLRRRF